MAIALQKEESSTDSLRKLTFLQVLKAFCIRLFVVVFYNVVAAFAFVHIEAAQSASTASTRAFINITRQRLTPNLTAIELTSIADEIFTFVAARNDENHGDASGPMSYEERYTMWLYFCFVSCMTIGKNTMHAFMPLCCYTAMPLCRYACLQAAMFFMHDHR